MKNEMLSLFTFKATTVEEVTAPQVVVQRIPPGQTPGTEIPQAPRRDTCPSPTTVSALLTVGWLTAIRSLVNRILLPISMTGEKIETKVRFTGDFSHYDAIFWVGGGGVVVGEGCMWGVGWSGGGGGGVCEGWGGEVVFDFNLNLLDNKSFI